MDELDQKILNILQQDVRVSLKNCSVLLYFITCSIC
ncbi:AsnC family protein [Lactococcus chungangensis]